MPIGHLDTGLIRAPGSLGLPHEILERIFQMYYDIYNADGHSAYYGNQRNSVRIFFKHWSTPPWLFVIPHTCILWRTLSLQLPSLWTTVCLEWPEPQIAWVVEHNQCTGLRLLWLLELGLDVVIPSVIMEWARIIKELDAPRTMTSAHAVTELLKVASSLHTLHTTGLPLIHPTHDTPMAILPASLRHLCLRLPGRSGRLPPLSELRSLSLIQGRLTSLWDTIDACLSTIQEQYPRLKRLILSSCELPISCKSTRVYFPHLKEFSLIDSWEHQAAALLACIALPSDCRTLVMCTHLQREEWMPILDPALSVFTSTYREHAPTASFTWRAATLAIRRNLWVSVVGGPRPRSWRQYNDSFDDAMPPLHLGFPVPYTDGEATARAVRGLLGLLPIATLEKLTIRVPSPDANASRSNMRPVEQETILLGDQINIDVVGEIVVASHDQRDIRYILFEVDRWDTP